MRNKLSIAVFGLVALCASQAWAGSHGNGADQRRAAAGLPPLQQETAPRPQPQPQQQAAAEPVAVTGGRNRSRRPDSEPDPAAGPGKPNQSRVFEKRC